MLRQICEALYMAPYRFRQGLRLVIDIYSREQPKTRYSAKRVVGGIIGALRSPCQTKRILRRSRLFFLRREADGLSAFIPWRANRLLRLIPIGISPFNTTPCWRAYSVADSNCRCR